MQLLTVGLQGILLCSWEIPELSNPKTYKVIFRTDDTTCTWSTVSSILTEITNSQVITIPVYLQLWDGCQSPPLVVHALPDGHSHNVGGLLVFMLTNKMHSIWCLRLVWLFTATFTSNSLSLAGIPILPNRIQSLVNSLILKCS